MGKGEHSRIIVGNLSYNATESDLRELFSEFGDIEFLNIPRNRNISKGLGIIDFKDVESANKAYNAYHEKQIFGRTCYISFGDSEPTKSNKSKSYKKSNNDSYRRRGRDSDRDRDRDRDRSRDRRYYRSAYSDDYSDQYDRRSSRRRRYSSRRRYDYYSDYDYDDYYDSRSRRGNQRRKKYDRDYDYDRDYSPKRSTKSSSDFDKKSSKRQESNN